MINRLLSERHRLLPFLIRHFSSSKEELLSRLSAGAQRALWAQKIINKIAYADVQLANDITNPSLRQLIIQCQNPIEGVDFNDTDRKEVINMFESGIQLNRQVVFTQGRVLGGLNLNKLFMFCPNLLATKPIFLQLRNPTKYIVFHDSYGISKTISIIMFIELSRHIHKYIYDVTCSDNKELEEEYKMLRQNQYLTQMTKYWYWSIESVNKIRPGYLQEKIAAQATQLSQEQRLEIKNCLTPSDAINLVKTFYSKTNISHNPIVDQINKLASLMRNWNAYQEKHRQNIKTSEDIDSAALQGYNNTVELDKYFKQFISISTQNGFVLNSSINLEANLLFRKKQKIKEYGSLSLKVIDQDDKHEMSALSYQKFNYLTNIFKPWGKNDFWHSCWFEFSRNIIKTISKNALVQLRQSFLNHVNSLEIKQYYRFLEINLFLKKKDDIISGIVNITDAEQQTKQIKMLMSTFDEYCFEKCVNRAEYFFTSKGDSGIKRDFLRAMYVIALKKKIRGQKQLIISMDILDNHVMASELKPIHYFLSNEHDKELIPFQSVRQLMKEIKILWGTDLFCKIIEHVLYKQFPYQQVLMNRFQKKMLQNKTYFGTYIEGLIVYQLQKECILQLMNVKKMRISKQVKGKKVYIRSRVDIDENSFKKDQYQIASVAYFDAFPLKEIEYSSFNFKQSLSNLITLCDKTPGQWVAAIPICSNKSSRKDQKIQSPNNPSVDFILAKRKDTADGKKYFLNCVDVTISRGSVSGKESNAKKLYKKLLTSSNQNTFQINHIILCPRKSCIGFLKEDKSNFTVTYSNIEAMRFEKSKYPNQLSLFQGVQRYFMLETIELEADKRQ